MRNGLLILLFLVSSVASADERPNIIFMMSDDQAWNGLSVAMHPNIPWSKSSVVDTPNLERLALQGMRFSAAYAPASVCSPTRISLQTGRSPAAMHWTKAAPNVTASGNFKMLAPRLVKQINANSVTIGERLQSAGYATAHFGKWHINGGGPSKHGYDDGDGDIGNEYAQRYADPNPVDIFGMAKRAAGFMEKSKRENKPFFIQMSWHALHSPGNAMKSSLAKYAKRMGGAAADKRIGFAAIAEDLDSGVGMVVDAVDRLGLADNTYVIYMSDNGSGGAGGKRRGGLSGGKGSVWEGGIRSPLIIRGPKVPANSWCHERVVGYDFYPTFCGWAGLDPSRLPSGIEGGCIDSLLDDGKGVVERPREELVFHFPHYQSGDGPHSALFLGQFKLMKFYETGRLALFNINADISEQNDLVNQRPEQAKALEERLEGYLKEVQAQFAIPNPQYDSSRPQAELKKGKKGGKGRSRKNNYPRRTLRGPGG